MTRVINIKSGEPYDVYIGRWNKHYKLPASIWANPYKIGKDGTGKEVLDKYYLHIQSRPDLLARLHELKGKTLACWCKVKGDEPCHGDVLIKILNNL